MDRRCAEVVKSSSLVSFWIWGYQREKDYVSMLGQLGKRRVIVLDTGAGVSSVCAGLHGPVRPQNGAVRYPGG